MQRDLRDTDLFREAEALHRALRQPGSGRIIYPVEIDVAPGAKHAVFAGAIAATVEGTPPTRICRIDLATGDTNVLTFGPNNDRLPKVAPDGTLVAFLSDRHKAGDFQLYLLDANGVATAAPRVEGWIEYLHWSPDGKHILLGVAGHGADISGGQGAVTSKQVDQGTPPWMPSVESGDETFRWRRAWVYDRDEGTVRALSRDGTNVWEACWCGNDAIAAIVSPGPSEGLWYTATLQVIDRKTGTARIVYKPKDQLGWPSASSDGTQLAVVEAVCSDRWLVPGDLRLIEVASGKLRQIDTNGVDVTHVEFRSNERVLIAGHRGFETVAGIVDVASGSFTERWKSQELTSGMRYISVAGIGDRGDFALIGEGFVRPLEVALVQQGTYKPVKSFSPGEIDAFDAVGAVEAVTWTAPDGLEIQGWLVLPRNSKAPHRLVMQVHGGPVWHWRPNWLGRPFGVPFLMLLKRGYAVFYPNPRGSSGRGQAFARHVYGDMGGADTYDYLSGLDALVARGIADPKRLYVTGGSYGGYMTSWLITQDPRFAAAVSVAPVINQVTEHLISNIPHFVQLFLDDHYTNPTGKYFTRSPLMHAHKTKTPTLNIAGALDRCTPPEEAVQFHNALLENGVESVLVIYPEEGHGVRNMPAAADYAARQVDWFETHAD